MVASLMEDALNWCGHTLVLSLARQHTLHNSHIYNKFYMYKNFKIYQHFQKNAKIFNSVQIKSATLHNTYRVIAYRNIIT